MHNVQVTDVKRNYAKSESNIAINPNNPQIIVAGSKSFRKIMNYDFTLATAYSTDGGLSWADSAYVPLNPGWGGISDPALAWDDVGNAYLVALPFRPGTATNYTGPTIGIAIYKSTDGGKTWSEPDLIHTSIGDDKQWAAGDSNPASPFHGQVYAVWDDGSNMRFARSLDHGNTWIGTGSNPAGSILVNDSFSPEINVAANGNVYIVWISGNEIKMIVSGDGGNSFQSVASPATDVRTLGGIGPHFPGETFRVLTIPTACVFGQTVVVAWADVREGVSRIYYALSTNGGTTWTTDRRGQPLLTDALPANFHHFHPQIITDPNGVIGCAFYEFGPKPSTPLIDVIMAQSFNGGASFNHFTVTDQPWDPAVAAPWAHGNPNVTFIGDYFGLDASYKGFYPLWTDTRTGLQELWTAIIPVPGTIRGKVTDDTGRPLTGATVASGSISAQTNSVGNYTLAHVPSGFKQVRASKATYLPSTKSATVNAGQTIIVDFELEKSDCPGPRPRYCPAAKPTNLPCHAAKPDNI